HGIKAHLLCELEYLPARLLIIRQRHHTVIDRPDFVLLQLHLKILDHLVRSIVIDFGLRIGAELLPREKLDNPPARCRRLLDRLKRGEPVKSVSLAAKRKWTNPVLVRNFVQRPKPRSEEHSGADKGNESW